MAVRTKLDKEELSAFDASYDPTHEDIAAQARGEFLLAFPKDSLAGITLDDYAIGRQTPSFCTYVEARTKSWANIQGSTANKFGIYFGRTKSDPVKKYRFTRKFGNTAASAFQAAKSALLNLVQLGSQSNPDFVGIDANPLSQMFKAKILSLYYPEKFLNVCSNESLEVLGNELGIATDDLPLSEVQHLLVEVKNSNSLTRGWSNPKFMAFLFENYMPGKRKAVGVIRKPRKRAHRKVNFEDVQGQRGAIGLAAEVFALEWEKQRLAGLNLHHLIEAIEDRRDRPGYGYDFLSHTSKQSQRYIEVKSVGKLRGGEGHRFFLSDNEHTISKLPANRAFYYFYLVFFNSDGKPDYLQPMLADELYERSELLPASFVVRFDIG